MFAIRFSNPSIPPVKSYGADDHLTASSVPSFIGWRRACDQEEAMTEKFKKALLAIKNYTDKKKPKDIKEAEHMLIMVNTIATTALEAS